MRQWHMVVLFGIVLGLEKAGWSRSCALFGDENPLLKSAEEVWGCCWLLVLLLVRLSMGEIVDWNERCTCVGGIYMSWTGRL